MFYNSKSSLFRSVVYDLYFLYPDKCVSFYVDYVNNQGIALSGFLNINPPTLTLRTLKTVTYWLTRNGYIECEYISSGGRITHTNKTILQPKNF